MGTNCFKRNRSKLMIAVLLALAVLAAAAAYVSTVAAASARPIGVPFGVTVAPEDFRMLGGEGDAYMLSSEDRGIVFSAVIKADVYNEMLDKKPVADSLEFGMIYSFPQVMALTLPHWTERDIVMTNAQTFSVKRENSWYSQEIDGEEYFRYDAVITDVPESAYELEFVVRPYLKADAFYFYGEAETRSVMETAQSMSDTAGLPEDTAAFAQEIRASKLFAVHTDDVLPEFAALENVAEPTVSSAFPQISYGGGAAAGDTVQIRVTDKPDWMRTLSGFTVTPESGEPFAAEKLSEGEYAFTMPASSVTVSGEYEAEAYSISFVNYDGTPLQTDESLPYGSMPEYEGTIPVRLPSEYYTYEFSGWSPAVSVVREDATYTAQFTAAWQDGQADEYVLADFDEAEYAERTAFGAYGYDMPYTTEVLESSTDRNGVTYEGVLKIQYGKDDTNENSLQVDFGRPVLRSQVSALTMTFRTVNALNLIGGTLNEESIVGTNVLTFGYAERFRLSSTGSAMGPWANSFGPYYNRTDHPTINDEWITVTITNPTQLDWSMDPDGYIRSIWIETFNSRNKALYIADISYIPCPDAWTDESIADNVLSDFVEQDYVYKVTGAKSVSLLPEHNGEQNVLKVELEASADWPTVWGIGVNVWFGKPVNVQEVNSISFKLRTKMNKTAGSDPGRMFLTPRDADFWGAYRQDIVFDNGSPFTEEGSEWKTVTISGDMLRNYYADADGMLRSFSLLFYEFRGSAEFYVADLVYESVPGI